MDSSDSRSSATGGTASDVLVIHDLPEIVEKKFPPGMRVAGWGKITPLPKEYVQAAELVVLPVTPQSHPDDRISEWSQKEKTVKALADSLQNCPDSKSREALKLMCEKIEDVFMSGHEGSTDKAIEMVAKYLLPGAMQVLRKQGYYRNLETFVSPEEVKADLSASKTIKGSRFYDDIGDIVVGVHESTVEGLKPLEVFQQLSGSIYIPNPNAPLKDITQSVAEAYVLVGNKFGWEAAQSAILKGLQEQTRTRL